MADKLMRAQVTIPMDSGVPEDSVVNTFYFDGDDFPGAGDDFYHEGVMSLLTAFYHDIDANLFARTVGSEATVRIYDMRDAMPRIPELVDTIGLEPSAGDPLPSEVALCCSFAAAMESGVPAARRRGRVYLGPINDTQVAVVGSHLRPASDLLAVVASAAGDMQNGYNTGAPADSSIRWAIYSPKTDSVASIDDAFNDVVGGWVDNEFDTQRRRGPAATSRTTFS